MKILKTPLILALSAYNLNPFLHYIVFNMPRSNRNNAPETPEQELQNAGDLHYEES